MPTIHPLFSAAGSVTLLICEEEMGTAIVVDPEPGQWERYVKRAERAGCKIQVILATRPCEQVAEASPVARVCPVGVAGDRVQVRLGGQVSELPLGMTDAVVRVRGMMVAVVVVSNEGAGELAFLLPDGGIVIGGRRLCAPDYAEPVGVSELIPDWTLGIFEGGTVYSTRAPDGVFRRPIEEETNLREITRSRILRRLAVLGGTNRGAVASALGL